MTEEQVRMATKLYDARDAARVLLGDRYSATIASGAQMIRAVMDKHGCGELDAALKLGKEVKDDARALMIVLASAVEMMEPTL